MNHIAHLTSVIFLLGFIAASSLVAATFFLRFWKDTRDILFLAFVIFFLIQAIQSVLVLQLRHPNEGTAWFFLLRLLSVLSVLAAILWKNTRRR